MAKLKIHIGNSVEVLIEGRSRLKNNPQSAVSNPQSQQWFGRTRQNIVAVFPYHDNFQSGDIVNVTVTDASAYTLFAKLVE